MIQCKTNEFENYVNYAGSKTEFLLVFAGTKFENYVNYAGSKTNLTCIVMDTMFENYVNYAGSKTLICFLNLMHRLRTM